MTQSTDKWQKFTEEQQANPEEISVTEAVTDQDQRDPAWVELEQQLSEARERLLRHQADMDNFRRRAERDVENAHKYSTEKILKALLPVVDSLEKSLEHEKDETLVQGVQMTLDLLLDVLHKNHIQVINPHGEAFNPSLHEAMATEIAPELKTNTIVRVFQKGYLLHDRLIRPAFVVVSKQA